MNASVLKGRQARPLWLMFAGIALAAALLGAVASGLHLEAWYVVFVLLAGLTAGSLGLLTIGHMLGEDWLAPIREELEAASLTGPLLLVLAAPLGLELDAVFPWALGGTAALPRARALYFGEAFFLWRSLVYLVAWSAVGIWVVRSAAPRRASGIGLAILVPTVVFAANDWVMSRDPEWWSSLFGFAFAVSQLLGALAGAIFLTLLVDPRAHTRRLMSLERALLTLALLTLWIWFSQFLIVWLANLPPEVGWYEKRGGERLGLLIYGAAPALALAVALLMPSGVGRWTMMTGSALLVVCHLAHTIWLLNPRAAELSAGSLAVAAGGLLLWTAWFVVWIRVRPSFHDEALREPR